MGLFGFGKKKTTSSKAPTEAASDPEEAIEAPAVEADDGEDEDEDVEGVDLPRMIAAIQAAAPEAAEAPADLVLLRAQWGDLCRDGDLPRPDAAAFEPLASDESALKRATLLMSALLSQPDAADLAWEGSDERDADGHVTCSLVLPATRLELLTPQLLAESDLRAEEMARAFAASLGVSVRGETEEASEAALRRLDYRRLLAGADRAKAKAADKMDYLKQLYEAQEAARPRGKW